MPGKVLIFDDIVRQLPNVLVAIEQHGWEALLVSQGREVLPKMKESGASLAILDIFMPQMSGIELCRHIKEFDSPPKVILVCKETSDRIAQRALDYGCDLFTLMSEAEPKIVEFLEKNLQNMPAASPVANVPSAPPIGEERRSSARIEISGTVHYTLGNTVHVGELMNASDSGILYATKSTIPVGTRVKVSFDGLDGSSFELETEVARAVALKEPKGEFEHAIGGKFLHVPIEDKLKLEALLEYKKKKEVKMDAPTMRSILDLKVEDLPSVFSNPEDPLRIRLFAGELKPIDRESLNGENNVASCVRKIILKRAKATAFLNFIPILSADLKNLAPIFLPSLKELLATIEGIENEVDQVTRELVAAGNDEAKKGLNESSSRLHDGKLKLIFSIEAAIPGDGLLQGERTIIEEIKKRSAEIRALERPSEDLLKYTRRAPPPPPKKEDDKKKKKPVSKGLQITIIVVCSMIIGITLFLRMANKVPASDLMLPLAVDKAVVEEEGLQIFTKADAWDHLSSEDLASTFSKLQEFMKAKRLYQVLIFDENGSKVAAISSASQGRNKRLYINRVLRKPK